MIKDLWLTYKNTGCEEAREKIIKHYLPKVREITAYLVTKINYHVDYKELYCAGVDGLQEAIERYEIDSSNSFMQYANHRIRGAIYDYLRNNNQYSRALNKKSSNVDIAKRILANRFGRNASDVEVAEEMGITLDDLDEIKKLVLTYKLISLSRRNHKNDKINLHNLICDKRSKQPDYKLMEKDKHNTIMDFVKTLPKREKIMITLYYFGGKTYKEIAKILCLSESRISQINKCALRLLKKRISRWRILNHEGVI